MTQRKIFDLSQANLISRMNQFLGNFGEALYPEAIGGMCGGFSHLLALAILNNQEQKFIERISWLASADKLNFYLDGILSSPLERSAQLYKKYQEVGPSIQSESKLSESEQRVLIQNKRNEFKNNLSEEDKDLLSHGEDLYTFISPLMFSQDIRKSGISYNADQNNLEQLALIVSPVNQENSHLKRSHEFAMNLSETELESVLKNTLVSDNEVTRVTSTNHGMLAYKRGTKYYLYDPNSKTGIQEFNGAEDLAKAITFCLFTNISPDIKTDYMPIILNTFTLQNYDQSIKSRQSGADLIQGILNSRKSSTGMTNIDVKSWDGCSSLFLATLNNQSDNVLCYIKNKAESDITDYSAVFLAIKSKNDNLLTEILNNNVFFLGTNSEGKSALVVAVESSNLNAIHQIFQSAIKKDMKERTCIFEVLLRGVFENCTDERIRNTVGNIASLYIDIDKKHLIKSARKLANLLSLDIPLSPELTKYFRSHKKEIFDAMLFPRKADVDKDTRKIFSKDDWLEYINKKLEYLEKCLAKDHTLNSIFNSPRKGIILREPDYLIAIVEEIKKTKQLKQEINPDKPIENKPKPPVTETPHTPLIHSSRRKTDLENIPDYALSRQVHEKDADIPEIIQEAKQRALADPLDSKAWVLNNVLAAIPTMSQEEKAAIKLKYIEERASSNNFRPKI